MKKCQNLLCAVTITVSLVIIMTGKVQAATNAEINQAITNGLAWLAAQQNTNGSFGSGPYPVAYTGIAVLAFENEGNFPEGGQMYSEVVEKGLDFIFGYARVITISNQTAGNPDSDGDGIGVAFWDDSPFREVYETGIVMQAIIASNTPDRIVTTGPCAGQTYRDVMVDLVDWAAFGQVDAGTGRGGWRYYANFLDSDNSTAQWPVLGLLAAEQWGINAPQWVKDELNIWIDYIQNDVNGGSGYNHPDYLVNMSKTGGLLVEMDYVGDDQNTDRVKAALDFVDSKWSDPPFEWYGNKGHSYAMFSVFKGLELLNVETIPSAPANDETPAGDWLGDYHEYLVNTQRSDGGWDGYYHWNQWMSTGWYIVILQGTIIPVTVEVNVSSCECDNTGYDVTVEYSAQRFEVNGTLDLYLDGDLVESVPVVDFQGSNTHVYAAPAGDSPGSHTWKAVLSVTGGGNTAEVEDSDELFVCEAPVLDGIPDQTSPFAPIDLLSYVSIGPDAWTYNAPEGWEVTIVENIAVVTAPEGATTPVEITFTAASLCCDDDIQCEDSDVAVFTPMIPVAIDVKPTSCPNPINTKSGGVIPVAILGTIDFNVLDVDPTTITLNGVPALHWEIEDVAAPYPGLFSEEPECMECTTDGADGFDDLTLKFDKKSVVEALGEVDDGDCLLVTLSGNIYDGTPIEGMDVIKILKKNK